MGEKKACFAKHRVIAFECRICVRTLISHLQHLEEIKLIKKKRVWKINYYSVGEYFDDSSAADALDKVIVCSPCSTSHAVSADNPAHLMHMTIDIEKKNKRERIKPTEPPTGFLQFWALYLKKEGRKPSLAKWISQNLESQAEQIIKVLKIQNELIYKNKELRFIPNPLTYLSQERWHDEIMEDSNATSQKDSNLNNRQNQQEDYFKYLERVNKH